MKAFLLLMSVKEDYGVLCITYSGRTTARVRAFRRVVYIGRDVANLIKKSM